MGGGRKRKPAAQQPKAAATPTIYEATLGGAGAVVRVQPAITQVEAEALRRNGGDVVVCGADMAANRALAQTIERNANGTYKRCPPHK
jgi:hypothetical protein